MTVRPGETEGEPMAARAVSASSPALEVEIEATRFPLAELPDEEVAVLERLPGVVRRIAARAGAAGTLLVPARLGGHVIGCLELMRASTEFSEPERRVGRLAAAQLALLIAAAPDGNGAAPTLPTTETLGLAGQ